MFQKVISVTILVSALLATVSGECANACNGHGKCTSYDMCICNRNWQAADCSERVCQFGIAHVDTPKGDLNGDGVVSGSDTIVADNSYVYPYGTTEQFPQMEDTDLNRLTDSAHYYMECSNKGTCDRATGECQCFDGYDGVACQRASCPGYPNSCSGHGVCKTKEQLARADNGNVYKLWDRASTMGCECDAGYFGPDCSERSCKYGIDPLYLDDSATIKFSTWDFATLTTGPGDALYNFSDGMADTKSTGTWAIRYYDNSGEDWLTRPIVGGASCDEVIAALESIPNDVIPPGLTTCIRTAKDQFPTSRQPNQDTWYQNIAKTTTKYQKGYNIFYNLSIWEAYTGVTEGEDAVGAAGMPLPGSGDHNNLKQIILHGYIYRIRFFGNPGGMKQPDIEVHLDGLRPTLIAQSGYKIVTKVWTDGQQGEYNDYFADHCDGVTAQITHYGGGGDNRGYVSGNRAYGSHWLGGLSTAEVALLKKCLGPSDFDNSNNVEVYNWDYGNSFYPHIVKLVRSVTTYIDGGYYAVLFWDSSSSVFRLVNPFVPPDALATDVYEVYTTKGVLAMTSNASQAVFSFASKTVYMVNSTYDTLYNNLFDGDVSCEIGNNNAYKLKYIHHCLNKTDLFTLLSWDAQGMNPPNINLYTANRLITRPYQHLVGDRSTSYVAATTYTKAATDMSHFLVHTVTTDISTNWGSYTQHEADASDRPKFRIYKFFPSADSTYNYVAECSNRGLCQRDTGLCSCFPGYTNDDCSVQNSIAL